MKNGELWYPLIEFSNDRRHWVTRRQIMRLNLETGIENPTGIELVPADESWGVPIWIGENLFISTSLASMTHEVSQVIGHSLVKLDSTWLKSISTWDPPFEYEGHLTMVEATKSGSFRLISWVDGKWSAGREILLPEPNQGWFDDPGRSRKVLLPRSSKQPPPTTAPPNTYLNVVRQGNDSHLILTNWNTNFFAYRRGFEFVDENTFEASALMPANAPKEVSGWEPISSFPGREGGFLAMSFSRNEHFFLTSYQGPVGRTRRQKLFRRFQDSRSKQLSEDFDSVANGKEMKMAVIAANPNEDVAYLIRYTLWGGFTISRIEGDTVHPAHAFKSGCEREYLAFWGRLVTGLFVAWLSHAAILLIGASWLSNCATYEFGVQTVTLASFFRRASALALDIAFLACTAGVVWIGILGDQSSRFEWPSTIEIANDLYSGNSEYSGEEALFYSRFPASISMIAFGRWNRMLIPFLERNREILGVVILSVIGVYILKLWVESRCGITPGKWLVGIRTIRTTLRPAGFPRTLVRDALIWCDIPMLLTPLPAAISMIFSDQRQRLGDRVADTIVIRANSIRDSKRAEI